MPLSQQHKIERYSMRLYIASGKVSMPLSQQHKIEQVKLQLVGFMGFKCFLMAILL
jgi:hypothetical protein